MDNIDTRMETLADSTQTLADVSNTPQVLDTLRTVDTRFQTSLSEFETRISFMLEGFGERMRAVEFALVEMQETLRDPLAAAAGWYLNFFARSPRVPR